MKTAILGFLAGVLVGALVAGYLIVILKIIL